MIEKNWVEIDGTKVFYLDARPDDPHRIAPAMILVHGFLVSGQSWADILPALAERFRVLVPDLPGQGDSENWQNPRVSFSRYASFVHAFAEKLGVRGATLVGHSMGAGIAIAACATYPQVFGRGIFMDAVSYPMKLALKAKVIDLPVIGPFIFKKVYGWGMFRSYFRNDVFLDRSLLNEERLKGYYAQFDPPGRRDFCYNLFKMVSHSGEVAQCAPSVSVPSLVVWGGKDRLIPLSCGLRLSKELTNTRLEIVAQCGHAPQEEKPQETLKLILGFMQQ